MPKTAQGCAICTFTLPAGRRCGAVALRGRAFCYHHDRSPRRIAQDTLDIKLARYRRELESMDLPRLLEALLEKLDLSRPSFPATRKLVSFLALPPAVWPCSCRITSPTHPRRLRSPIHTASSPRKSWRHSPTVSSAHKRSMAQRSILESIRYTKSHISSHIAGYSGIKSPGIN
jgi:hypothetical protein